MLIVFFYWLLSKIFLFSSYGPWCRVTFNCNFYGLHISLTFGWENMFISKCFSCALTVLILLTLNNFQLTIDK